MSLYLPFSKRFRNWPVLVLISLRPFLSACVVMCPDIEYIDEYIQPVGSASIILGKKRRLMVDTLQHAFILVRTTSRIGPCVVFSNVGKNASAGLVTICPPASDLFREIDA